MFCPIIIFKSMFSLPFDKFRQKIFVATRQIHILYHNILCGWVPVYEVGVGRPYQSSDVIRQQDQSQTFGAKNMTSSIATVTWLISRQYQGNSLGYVYHMIPGCPRRPINPIIGLVVLYLSYIWIIQEGICPILFLKMSYKSDNLGLLSYNYFQIYV